MGRYLERGKPNTRQSKGQNEQTLSRADDGLILHLILVRLWHYLVMISVFGLGNCIQKQNDFDWYFGVSRKVNSNWMIRVSQLNCRHGWYGFVKYIRHSGLGICHE